MTKAFLGITYSLTHKVIPVSWLFRRRWACSTNCWLLKNNESFELANVERC
jgi:hypothetical protein